ncbi:MAG TPA: hypothetical protein VKT81_25615 [Bryobacteraceae bacterium]|nr:hypothetical protein [Bryobacteraceae bacterium]
MRSEFPDRARLAFAGPLANQFADHREKFRMHAHGRGADHPQLPLF